MINCAIITITISFTFLAFNLPLSNTYAQNETGSFTNCRDASMKLFLSQMALSPPEIKFNLSRLTSPEVQQYASDFCNFYYEKSGVWLSGTENEFESEIITKYGTEFTQKVKAPEIIKELVEAYSQLINKTK